MLYFENFWNRVKAANINRMNRIKATDINIKRIFLI